VKNYDLDIIYENVKIGNAKTSTPFTVKGDSWFDVPTVVDIQFDSAKGILDEFGVNLLLEKPMYIDVKGDMNVQFSNINKKIIFNKKDILLTENLGKDLGISKPLSEINKFLNKLGIKI
jgi:LEA14-like dessication related protein